ncbi:DUF3515 family protein [Kocuria tytonis]|uniref:DUF3515 family protein n=1 Tax=Kocuria tytonis TaxID=2054280 RepID=A0A495ACW9_9MICC|nr:DUF3515 family protein [Kocuria tytonis]RKQ36605.1 DUF3515 family protein [Kocuria tytonis]
MLIPPLNPLVPPARRPASRDAIRAQRGSAGHGAGGDAGGTVGTRVRATAWSRTGRRRLTTGAAALTGVLALTGCGSAVTVEGAPHAADPACASVMLAMPGDVSDMEQRETSSQGTTAYGEPSAMIVRCGVEEPGPTPDPCTDVNGVDWLISEVPEQKDQWRAVTYGRSPAVEVLFDGSRVPSSTALVDAGSAVQNVPQTRKCLSVKDTLEQQGRS